MWPVRGYPKDGHLVKVRQPGFAKDLKNSHKSLSEVAKLTKIPKSHLVEFAQGKVNWSDKTVARLRSKIRAFREGSAEWQWFDHVTKEEWDNRVRVQKEESEMPKPLLKCRIDQGTFSEAHARSGLTMQDIAKKAGVSLQTLYRVKAGKHYPRAATAKAIADALGVDVLDLFKIEDGGDEA